MTNQNSRHDTGVSHTQRLFDILRVNLVGARSEHATSDQILCPLCLRPLAVSEMKSVEHIIPRNALEDDPDYMKSTSLSRRAGLTVLCREPRTNRRKNRF
jgi:hypothetical protein